MKRLAELYHNLDQSRSTTGKVHLLADYFRTAPDQEKVWVLAIFGGRPHQRPVRLALLRSWAAEAAAIPPWLFTAAYEQVGDLAETIALILPPPKQPNARSAMEWIHRLSELRHQDQTEQKRLITEAWSSLESMERLVFNKLITGGLRIGVSQAVVTRALSQATGIDPSLITERLMGNWSPLDTPYAELIRPQGDQESAPRPYPFCLAQPLGADPESLGPTSQWLIEWKWDGIRGQLIHRRGCLSLWSRNGEMIAHLFPEFQALSAMVPEGTVLDGEILPFLQRPLSFHQLQSRLGRKRVTSKLMQEVPVIFMAYDLLEYAGVDLRTQPMDSRRQQLLQAFGPMVANRQALLRISQALSMNDWEAIDQQRKACRDQGAEGLMVKRRDAPYTTGRSKGVWWKWKQDPLVIDAVLLYAQPGHGRRSGLYTDYTLGVWKGQNLVPLAKAYSGLTDAEITQVDAFIKRNTLGRKGPLRVVKPELVFEIGFADVQPSKRHQAGLALRFPRILRWRQDKPASEADTLARVSALLPAPLIDKQPQEEQLTLSLADA